MTSVCMMIFHSVGFFPFFRLCGYALFRPHLYKAISAPSRLLLIGKNFVREQGERNFKMGPRQLTATN